MNAVTVIGLGAMGLTLANLFKGHGRDVTVWNRSPAKAAALSGVLTAYGVYQAMRAHASQLVWFRYLFIAFSRYTIGSAIFTPFS